MWVESPGSAYTDSWEMMSDTTSIEILPGNIDGNRFHAEWEGRDTNTSPDLLYSVLGFEGSMLGEFYGPYGEEVGGVLTGRSEATYHVVNGRFGAAKQ